jgi:hypothetical protein
MFFAKKDKYGGILLSFIFTAISCSLGNEYGHYYISFIPLLVIPYAFLYDVIQTNISKGKPVYLLLLITFFLFNASNIGNQSGYIWNNYHTGFGAIAPHKMNQLKEIVAQNSEPTDKILVTGFQPAIYLYTKRTCATMFLYPHTYSFFPSKQNYEEAIEKSLPKIIIQSNDLSTWASYDLSTLLNNKYQQISTDIDDLEVWVLKEFE